MKKRLGDDEPSSVELPPLRADGFFHLEPAEVLSVRRVQHGPKEVQEALIKWKNMPIEEATWEEYDQLVASFPFFVSNLEDKVLFDRGSVDRIAHGGIENIVDKMVLRKSTRAMVPTRRYVVLFNERPSREEIVLHFVAFLFCRKLSTSTFPHSRIARSHMTPFVFLFKLMKNPEKGRLIYQQIS